jgi:hypothetical protein
MRYIKLKKGVVWSLILREGFTGVPNLLTGRAYLIMGTKVEFDEILIML